MKLVVAQPALAELHDTAAFYTESECRAWSRFVAEFERTANFVLTNPLLGAVFRGPRRRYILRRFLHSIIYQIAAEALRILAIAHHRRRPGYWKAT